MPTLARVTQQQLQCYRGFGKMKCPTISNKNVIVDKNLTKLHSA